MIQRRQTIGEQLANMLYLSSFVAELTPVWTDYMLLWQNTHRINICGKLILWLLARQQNLIAIVDTSLNRPTHIQYHSMHISSRTCVNAAHHVYVWVSPAMREPLVTWIRRPRRRYPLIRSQFARAHSGFVRPFISIYIYPVNLLWNAKRFVYYSHYR